MWQKCSGKSLIINIYRPDEEQDSLPSRRGCAEVVEILAAEVERLHKLLECAPVAIMDTRDALGICAPTEDAFPALYALQGKRVRLVIDDETPNVKLTGCANSEGHQMSKNNDEKKTQKRCKPF